MSWSPAEDKLLRQMHGQATFEEMSVALGRKIPAVKWRITKLGIAKRRMWSAEEEAQLIEIYTKAGSDGFLDIQAFADRIGRDPKNISRKAGQLGLETSAARAKVANPKGRPEPMFDNAADRAAYTSKIRKAWHAENEHPKGMLGKKHTPETLAVLAQRSRDTWLFTPEHRKEEIINKSLRTKRAATGSIPPKVARGSWKAGWREIGGKRVYFRSRWEANYARYLQWLLERGAIAEWLHEPRTFWFESIKRGVRSYLPDFQVTENSGAVHYHEVKGWMDARSRTTISRFKKYYPDEKLIVIEEKAYKAIAKKVSPLVEGWE